jgi:hypothetical protein
MVTCTAGGDAPDGCNVAGPGAGGATLVDDGDDSNPGRAATSLGAGAGSGGGSMLAGGGTGGGATATALDGGAFRGADAALTGEVGRGAITAGASPAAGSARIWTLTARATGERLAGGSSRRKKPINDAAVSARAAGACHTRRRQGSSSRNPTISTSISG